MRSAAFRHWATSVRVRTVVDESLRRFATVWCAAGTPRAVFEVETERLIEAIQDADVRAVNE